jgi:hypothetical protein
LIDAFIYEGERIGMEYPDGTVLEIPPHKVHMVLRPERLPDGSPCHILAEKTPMTRLDIVLMDPS